MNEDIVLIDGNREINLKNGDKVKLNFNVLFEVEVAQNNIIMHEVKIVKERTDSMRWKKLKTAKGGNKC